MASLNCLGAIHQRKTKDQSNILCVYKKMKQNSISNYKSICVSCNILIHDILSIHDDRKLMYGREGGGANVPWKFYSKAKKQSSLLFESWFLSARRWPESRHARAMVQISDLPPPKKK